MDFRIVYASYTSKVLDYAMVYCFVNRSDAILLF